MELKIRLQERDLEEEERERLCKENPWSIVWEGDLTLLTFRQIWMHSYRKDGDPTTPSLVLLLVRGHHVCHKREVDAVTWGELSSTLAWAFVLCCLPEPSPAYFPVLTNKAPVSPCSLGPWPPAGALASYCLLCSYLGACHMLTCFSGL